MARLLKLLAAGSGLAAVLTFVWMMGREVGAASAVGGGQQELAKLRDQVTKAEQHSGEVKKDLERMTADRDQLVKQLEDIKVLNDQLVKGAEDARVVTYVREENARIDVRLAELEIKRANSDAVLLVARNGTPQYFSIEQEKRQRLEADVVRLSQQKDANMSMLSRCN